MTLEEAAGFLYAALQSRIGILLRTNDPEAMRQKLYSARRSQGIEGEEMAELQIRMSPFPEGDLIIVNRRITPSASGDK